MRLEAPKTETYSEPYVCGHCGNKGAMQVLGTYDEIYTKYEKEDASGFNWQEGKIWELDKCPACESILLRQGYYHDGYHEDGNRYAIIYPTIDSGPERLPIKIRKALEAAEKVKVLDANAFALLLRRVLELVCLDKEAAGDRLPDKLKDLAKRDIVPDNLATMAFQLKELGNIGAHPHLGELTEKEIPILDDLCHAILEYVYTAPALVQKVEKKLESLKQQ